jgi:hypothetical protein
MSYRRSFTRRRYDHLSVPVSRSAGRQPPRSNPSRTGALVGQPEERDPMAELFYQTPALRIPTAQSKRDRLIARHHVAFLLVHEQALKARTDCRARQPRWWHSSVDFLATFSAPLPKIGPRERHGRQPMAQSAPRRDRKVGNVFLHSSPTTAAGKAARRSLKVLSSPRRSKD